MLDLLLKCKQKNHCYDLNFAMKYFVATKSILLTGKILHLITEVATLANLLCLHYTMIIDMHTLLLLILARSVLNNNLNKHSPIRRRRVSRTAGKVAVSRNQSNSLQAQPAACSVSDHLDIPCRYHLVKYALYKVCIRVVFYCPQLRRR